MMTTVLFGFARPAITASPSGEMRTTSKDGLSGADIFAAGSLGLGFTTAADFANASAIALVVGLDGAAVCGGDVISLFQRWTVTPIAATTMPIQTTIRVRGLIIAILMLARRARHSQKNYWISEITLYSYFQSKRRLARRSGKFLDSYPRYGRVPKFDITIADGAAVKE